jgi:hypothetical protein
MDAGFDYGRRGQEKEVKDKLEQRIGEAAAHCAHARHAPPLHRSHKVSKAVDTEVQGRIGSRTGPTASRFPSLLAISEVTGSLGIDLGEL